MKALYEALARAIDLEASYQLMRLILPTDRAFHVYSWDKAARATTYPED